MEGLYQQVIKQVSEGAHFQVDFKNRSLKINGKEVELKEPLGIEQYDDLDKWLDAVEDLYDLYKYSCPTKSSMRKERKSKFKALSISQLVKECGHDALNNPLQRDKAQASLEVFILLSLVNGSFDPEILFAKDWFYQGIDKDLIMRKDWF